jgi:hypothetical protein
MMKTVRATTYFALAATVACFSLLAPQEALAHRHWHHDDDDYYYCPYGDVTTTVQSKLVFTTPCQPVTPRRGRVELDFPGQGSTQVNGVVGGYHRYGVLFERFQTDHYACDGTFQGTTYADSHTGNDYLFNVPNPNVESGYTQSFAQNAPMLDREISGAMKSALANCRAGVGYE